MQGGSEPSVPKSQWGFATSLGGDELAEAVPAGSRLLVHVRPSQQLLLLYLRTFGLREELMHGERQQFGLSRSVYLLRRRARRRLLEVLLDEASPAAAAETIAETERIVGDLTAHRRPFLEAVDQYLVHSVVREDEYLARHAERFAEAHDEPVAEVVDHLEEISERIVGQVPNQEHVYDRLFEIEATHSRRVAETVADAALDIPYLIDPVSVPDIPAQSVADIDLNARFDAACDALEAIAADPESISREGLLLALRNALDGGDVGVTNRLTPRDIDIPLLDRPARPQAETSNLREGFDTMQSAPDVASILGSAFRFVGNFGGAVYYDPTGTVNWLVNPWVADEPVPDAPSYAALWERTYLLDRLVSELVEEARSERETAESLSCPLCAVSGSSACGESACACAEYTSAARARQGELREALRDAGVTPR